jgi:hypothetical protein
LQKAVAEVVSVEVEAVVEQDLLLVRYYIVEVLVVPVLGVAAQTEAAAEEAQLLILVMDLLEEIVITLQEDLQVEAVVVLAEMV